MRRIQLRKNGSSGVTFDDCTQFAFLSYLVKPSTVEIWGYSGNGYSGWASMEILNDLLDAVKKRNPGKEIVVISFNVMPMMVV